MPPATGPDASKTNLVELLQSLNIGTSGSWTPDHYLPVDVINTAFNGLPSQFLLIHGAFGAPQLKSFIPETWKALKLSLLTALCQPYRDAVKLAESNNTTKELEMSRLLKENIFKDSQIEELSHQNASKNVEIARLLEINTSKDYELAHLVDQNISKDSEISRLVADLDRDRESISKLSHQNASKDVEIARLLEINTSKDYELAHLVDQNISKDSDISRLVADLDRDRESISEQKLRLTKLENDTDYLHSENQRYGQQISQLLSAKQHPDGVPASITRTQTWKEVMADPYNRMFENLPRLEDVIRNDELAALGCTKYAQEPGMYIRVRKCLAEHLTTPIGETPGSTVFDTHAMEVLKGLKPDMTIVTADCTHPVAECVIATVELKKGSLNDDAFGQLYDYLKGIKQAQPHRRIVIGVLSNLRHNQFLALESVPGQRTRCIRYNSVTLDIAITYLQTFVIPSSLYHPPISLFSADLGPRGMHMGNPAFSTVAAFDILSTFSQPAFRTGRWVAPSVELPTGYAQIVVKRTTPPVYGMSFISRAPRSVKNEIDILRAIQDKPRNAILPGWEHLPTLFYHTDDFQEFGMLPRGFAISASDTHIPWPTVLVNVIDALEWLHTHHIIHRDVRLDNIIWDINHAVLIDLGAAIDVTMQNDSKIQFCGGYVCLPPELIGHLNTSYTPSPADDCRAVILLVNTILFPARWAGFRSCELEKAGSTETRILGDFWKRMATSQIWSAFYCAACAADYNLLKKMGEFFVYL